MRAITVSIVLLATAASAQRQTWVVGPGGFATLQAAFDAPQVLPGDIVLVRAATYRGAVLRKGLIVRADPGTSIDAGPIGPADALRVENLPATAPVLISGFTLHNAELSLSNCAGRVTIENVSAVQNANPNVWYAARALTIQQCPWVTATRLEGAGRSASVADSNVHLDQCSIVSLDGYSGFVSRASGGPAISVERSSLSIAASTLRGASILAGSAQCGSPALVLTDSSARATNDSTLRGGGAPSFNCNTPGIAASGNSALVIDAATQILPGTSNAPAITGVTATVRPTPSLTAGDFALGTTVAGVVQGMPGDNFAVVLGLAQLPVFVPFFGGELGLDVTAPTAVLASGSTANGTAPWSITLPNLPHLSGDVLGVQAVVGAAGLSLSNPLVRSFR